MIGLFGGTFDPVHLGHLRMALEICENNQLEQIRFIPCKNPVHKPEAVASATHRIEMLKLSIKGEKKFVLDTQEVDRESPSYMIETLRQLSIDMPGQSFGLILGSDALAGFTQWKDWSEIIQRCKLFVVHRALANPPIPPELRSVVIEQQIQSFPISSSEIRQQAKVGHSIRYWVTDAVAEYIHAHKLYR